MKRVIWDGVTRFVPGLGEKCKGQEFDVEDSIASNLKKQGLIRYVKEKKEIKDQKANISSGDKQKNNKGE